jgi:hypothetical protein
MMLEPSVKVVCWCQSPVIHFSAAIAEPAASIATARTAAHTFVFISVSPYECCGVGGLIID